MATTVKRSNKKELPRHKLTTAQKSDARLKRRNSKKQLEIKVIAAHELSAAQKEHIHKIFGEQKHLDIQIKPEILGGIVIQTEDKLFDGSLVTQLRRLKNHIMQS